MISHSKKFIFIHIPKSGGTSVNSALKQYCEFPPETQPGTRNPNILEVYKKHINIETMKQSGVDINDYFKFSIVRNSWARVLSLYFHRIQLDSRTIDTQEKNFNDWVKNVFLNEKLSHRYWANQLDYITINGVMVVDQIIRFENLLVGWDEVCKKLQIECQLPHHYKTVHSKYSDYYNEESKNIVHNIFKRDIKLFDYEF